MTVSIQLSGFFAIRVNDERQKLPIKGPTKRLLSFLCLRANKSHGRDFVVEQIWPDKDFDKGRSALSTAIWRIKQALAPFNGMELLCEDELIRFDIASDVNVDVMELEKQLSVITNAAKSDNLINNHAAKSVRKVMTKMNPELLSGHHDVWVLVERERHRMRYIKVLSLLMHHAVANGDLDDAINICLEILEIDFFREGVQREMIWLYLLRGERAKAIDQYNLLAKRLQDEFGVPPMLETQAVYNYVLSDKPGMRRESEKMILDQQCSVSKIDALVRTTFLRSQSSFIAGS